MALTTSKLDPPRSDQIPKRLGHENALTGKAGTLLPLGSSGAAEQPHCDCAMLQPVEEDRSQHATCSLRSALHFIGGRHVRISRMAYPRSVTPRLARLLQMGNCACHLLFSVGHSRILISGQQLAYLSGEVEYFNDHILSRAFRLLLRGQPFFIVPEPDPVASIASIAEVVAAPQPKMYLRNHCVVVILANWNGLPSVLHYGICDEARAEIRRGTLGLQIAKSDQRITELVPTAIACISHNDGAAMSVQSRLHGTPMEFSWGRVDQITELWLAGKPSTAIPARPSLSQELTELCDCFPLHREALCPIADTLLRWHSESQVPGDIAHGDLWIENVLFTGNTITGIVDWEWARSDGVRLLDVLNLIFMSYSDYRTTNVAHHLRQLWRDDIQDKAVANRMATLCSRHGMEKNDLKFMALLLWFDYLRQNTIRGRMPSHSWTGDMIQRTIPAIQNWLHSHKETNA